MGLLYSKWNQKVNLISRKDLDNLYERHVLHSLAVIRIIRFLPGANILDVGTGGGFPGIPLAIYYPGVQFHLIDSINKKVNAAASIVKDIALQNVELSHQRAEEVTKQFDFIVARAVTSLDKLVQWTTKNLKDHSRHQLANGWLVWKGGELHKELKKINYQFQEFQLFDHIDLPFFESKKIVHVIANISG